MKKTGTALMLGIALIGTDIFAGDAISAQSTYLGDGWFRYDVTLHYDPFFKTATLEGIAVDFTNLVAIGEDPSYWSNGFDQGEAGWAYSNNAPIQSRPYSVSFTARSTNTTFKSKPLALLSGGSLVPQDHLVSSYLAENMVYISRLTALVPCPPPEADGSSTSLYDSIEMVEDVRIDRVYMVSNEPFGLVFSWPTSCTVQIQAGTNFSAWTSVTNVLGYAPSTTWTSPVPLDMYGDYFRIRLLATEHRPDLL